MYLVCFFSQNRTNLKINSINNTTITGIRFLEGKAINTYDDDVHRFN